MNAQQRELIRILRDQQARERVSRERRERRMEGETPYYADARFSRERRFHRPSKESWSHRERVTPYGAAVGAWEDGADSETVSARMEALANGETENTVLCTRYVQDERGTWRLVRRIALVSDFAPERERREVERVYEAPQLAEVHRLGPVRGMDWSQ